MTKNLVDNTGKLLQQLTDEQVQGMQDLVDQGELFGRGLETAQNILRSTNQDIQITKSEYADILSILQQTVNVGQGIGLTIGEASRDLQSVVKRLSENVSILLRGDTVLKGILRDTYRLHDIANRIQAFHIEGDLWKLKDLNKARTELTRIETSLKVRGEKLDIPASVLAGGREARQGSVVEQAQIRSVSTQLIQQLKSAITGNGILSFTPGGMSNPEKVLEILTKYGATRQRDGSYQIQNLDYFSLPKIRDLRRELSILARESNEIIAVLSDLNELEELRRKGLEEEKKLSEETRKAIGSDNNKATTLSRIASKVGLHDAAEFIQSVDSEATRAAKIHLTTNVGDAEGARKAYRRVWDAGEVFNQIKESAAETYLNFGKWGGPLGAALALGIAIFHQLLQFDKQAVETKRVIGQWADASALANTSFVTGQEVLKTMVALGEQFHINPVQVFTSQELANIAKAQKFTGMTAEAAGNLAVQSKIAGKNADTYRDAIAKGANAGNALNRSAVSLSAVQNDVLQTSRAIALSYGNNTAELAKAATSAATLGTNLQGVEEIAKSLMNFESSISAEMQAQLLTGRQLNLAKAREYSLNNDLNGVAQEIKKQGMDAVAFSKMNYIQQEGIAKALGMSREQLSKMLILQELNSGLTARQVAAMTNMRKEDVEALSAQEKWQTMKQRFLESLIPLLEPILQVTSDILRLLSPIVGLVSTVVGWVSRFGNLIKEDNVYLRSLWTTVLAIGTVIGTSWIRGLGGVTLLGTRIGGIFSGIGRGILGASKGILTWVTNLGKARVAAQATNAVFDATANRWRNPVTGRFMTAPTRTAATGTAQMGSAVSSLGRNMGSIVKGAAAAAILAGAVWVLAKAAQEFEKVSWESIGKAAVGLVALTAVVAGLGALMTSGIGAVAILAGAAAIAVIAGSVWILGNALKQVTEVPGSELHSIASGIRSIAGAIGELAEKLGGLSTRKLNALGKAFKKLQNGQIQIATVVEPVGEIQGIQRENLKATAQEITVKQAQIQASAQQISVEQKAADLSRVEAKIDAVVKAVVASRPDWNWLEFERQAAGHGFMVNNG